MSTLDSDPPAETSGAETSGAETSGAARSGAAARKEERYETSWLVIIAIPGGQDVHATARDVSRSGAKLSVPAEIALPPVFVFKVVGKNIVARARVAWRRGNEVGVVVERTAPLPDKKPPNQGAAAPPAAPAPERPATALVSRHLLSRR